jgi:PH (Pleckstrin Homology) domain-containing protein
MNDVAVFGATWDQRLVLTTILVSSLVFGVTTVTIWIARSRDLSAPLRGLMLASVAIALGALLLGALLAPREYAVGPGSLTVRRVVGSVAIPMATIRSIERLAPESLAGSIRTLGASGAFGYYGRFRNALLGDYRMYATRHDGFVLVRAERLYVLTPDAPDRFIESVHRLMPRASGEAGADGGEPGGEPR